MPLLQGCLGQGLAHPPAGGVGKITDRVEVLPRGSGSDENACHSLESTNPPLRDQHMNNTTNKPQATVRLVAEHEATGRVREIYDDIKATKQIDFVPNFWRALASHPTLLEMAWIRLKT